MGELLTVNQVAQRVNMTATTVRRAIWEGRLKAHKIGRNHRISEEQLREWIGEPQKVEVK